MGRRALAGSGRADRALAHGVGTDGALCWAKVVGFGRLIGGLMGGLRGRCRIGRLMARHFRMGASVRGGKDRVVVDAGTGDRLTARRGRQGSV